MIAPQIIILGGGPAGLAAAHYAHTNKLSFLLLERSAVLGGNALTYSKGSFSYDSGAHRWHNVYPEITRDIASLLPGSFEQISVPSSISYNSKQIQFPLEPLDLIKSLSILELLGMGWSYLRRKSLSHPLESFAHSIQNKYGHKVKEAFLWHYSQKLWGESPEVLSCEVSGKRLKGLGFRSFFSKNHEHLDGAFYYPKKGIGEIFNKIASLLPQESYRLNSTIKSIQSDGNRIKSIIVNDQKIDCSEAKVINTLSPEIFSQLLSHKIETDIKLLTFRSLILVFFEIKRSSLSKYASIYFPDKLSPITRLVEPRNRSKDMAPPGMTSMVLEWPCSISESLWTESEDQILLKARAWAKLNLGLTSDEILEGEVKKLPMAYPILKLDSVKQRENYLSETRMIKNLHHLGRNATFSYLHLHDIFLEAKELIQG